MIASTSPAALGMYSRDDFERTSAGLKSVGKSDVTFLQPMIPAGATRRVIENVEVYTMTEMTEEEQRLLRADLAETFGCKQRTGRTRVQYREGIGQVAFAGGEIRRRRRESKERLGVALRDPRWP